MGKTDKKSIFWEGLKNSIFKMEKKLFFSVTKSRCLGEKKVVQFAWAKLFVRADGELVSMILNSRSFSVAWWMAK